MGGLEYLIELEVLNFELFRNCIDFFLEDEVMEAFLLLDCVDCVVEYLEEGLAFLFLVFVALHFDFVLILKISVPLLFPVDFLLDLRLLLDYFVLLEQVLSISLYLQLQLLVRLHQLLAFLLYLPEEAFVLVLLLVQFFDLVLELLDQVEVGRCYLGVVGFNVGVLLCVLSC
jgi:hypothetical protein